MGNPALDRKLRRFNCATMAIMLPMILAGFGLQFVGLAHLAGGGVSGDPIWSYFTGSLLLGMAFALIAKAQGQAWVWGLLGFLGFAGAVILMFLPRRCLNCGHKGGREGWPCPNCGEGA